MNQKRDSNTEDILNSFIDGELSQGQQIEVERLIANDAQTAQRLKELRKTKMLVSSLPRAEAPPEMVQEVRAALERKALLTQEPQRPAERIGARHLMARRLLAAAAMIGLVAVLGIVIYSIVAPETSTEGPIIGRPPKKLTDIFAFSGRLEFKTSTLLPADASIAKTIEDNTHVTCGSPRRQADRSVYDLRCTESGLNMLLWDLGSIWERFDSATLYLETEEFGQPVMVRNVTAGQIAEIAKQGTYALRIQTAIDFAILNNIAERRRDEQVWAGIDETAIDLLNIPKPRLTSGEEVTGKPTAPEDEHALSLTIVVTTSE